jgi:uncharacterized protein (TIGR03435 family)
MLQSLLAERFHLKFHFAKREVNGYALTVLNTGSKLQAAHESDQDLVQYKPDLQTSQVHMVVRHKSIKVLATFLSGSGHFDGPVEDKTELTGLYNFTLDWTATEPLDLGGQVVRFSGDAAPGISLATALQEQLGLQVRPEKTNIEPLVIDFVERPTPNQ